MANEIDLIVGSEAFAQITRLLTELGKVDTKLETLSTSFSNLGKGATNPSDSAALKTLTDNNAKLNAEILKLSKAYNELNDKLSKVNTTRTANTKGITEETVALRQKNAETTLEIKAGKDKAQTYAQLDAQHKLAVKRAQDEAVANGRATEAYAKYVKQANELGNQLRVIDTDIGKHTRNVGNYASSWNGLGNSINQLTREAPAFANSVQTGFMALSNNIPILTDEIGVLIQKNKDLQKDGKPTESILKTLAGAFFSWQTVISLGVTLLTVYGAKLFEMAFGLSDFEKSQKEVNDEMSKINNTTTVASVNLKILSGVVLDVTKSERDRKIALNELKEIIPELDTADINHVGTLKDVIYWTNKYIEASILRAQADYLAKTIAKDQTELDILKEKSDEDKMSFMQKTYLVLGKLVGKEAEVTAIIKDQIYYEQKDTEARLRRNTALLKTYEVKASGYEQELKGLNGSVKANAAADKAAETAAEKAIRIAKEKRENEFKGEIAELENKKNTAKNRLDLFRGEVKERIALSMNLASREIDLAEKVYLYNLFLAQKDAGLIKKAEAEKSTAIANSFKENIERSGEYYSDFFKKADDALPKSIFGDTFKMTEEDKKILKDSEDYLKKTLSEIDNYIKSFSTDFASNLGLKETFDFFIAVDEKGKTMWQKLDMEGVSSEEKFRARFNAIAEASQEMFNKMAEFSQAHYEEDYRRLEAQKETSIKFAGENTAAKEKIEADFAKKKKEIDKRKFESDKKISMVNIAIDTAQAVVATLAKGGGFFASPLAIIVAAMGAIQLGMVAAQQFPAYAEGTDNHSGGLMLVNDGAGSNYQEKVILPSGKVIRPQGRNVLMDAPKGTKVLNHEQQLFEMLQSNNISMSSQGNSGLTYDEMNEIFQNNFANIKTQNTIFDKNGFQTYVRNGNSITRSNSNRSQAIGISV